MAKRVKAQVASDDKVPGGPTQEKKLKFEHEKFARHYSRYGNATVAYHHAYPDAIHSSCGTAGSRLLQNVEVLAFIELLKEQDRVTSNYSRQEYFRNMTSIARDPFSKQQREANNDLWDKLGLGDESDNRPGSDTIGNAIRFFRGIKKSGTT